MPVPSESSRSLEASPEEATQQRRRRLVFDAARAHWPNLDVDFEYFCRELERLGYHSDQPTHAASLYLSMACSRGCSSACHALEAQYFPALRSFVASFDARPEVVDDLLQQIRHRLLVGPNPRIRTYSGKGAFRAWLRRVAQAITVDTLRTNIGRERLTRRLEREAAYVELVHSAPPPAPDEHADRERYGRVARRTLSQVIQALPNDHRRLLYHYYFAGMSIDQLGSLYSVDCSTAARRLGRVVQEVQRTLRVALAGRLGPLAAKELEDWGPVLYRKAEGGTGPTCPDLLQPDAPPLASCKSLPAPPPSCLLPGAR